MLAIVPHVPAIQSLCSAAPWEELRLKVGLKHFRHDFVQQVFHDSRDSVFYQKVATRVENGFREYKEECLPGFEVLHMLSLESNIIYITSHSVESASSRMLLMANALIDSFLGRIFLPIENGTFPSWHTLGALDWSLFRLGARLRNVFFGIAEREEVLSALRTHFDDWLLSCNDTLRQATLSLISTEEAYSGGKLRLALSMSSLMPVFERVQVLVHSWALRAMSVGFSRDYILAAILVLDCQQGLLEELDRQFLSDTVLLQLPWAVHRLGKIQHDIKKSPRWKNSNCRRSFHGRNLMGVPKLAQSFVASVSARHRNWRCGVAMRVIRSRDSYMSDLVRRRGELHCSEPIVRLLWVRSEAMLTNGSPHKVHFMEVGSSLGDCMLAASALLPEGKLHGLAFEAEPSSASVLRESVTLNGLDGRLGNKSRVDVHEAYVSNSSRNPVTVIRALHGLPLRNIPEQVVDKNREQVLELSTVTLDEIWKLKNITDNIDILHVHANGAEMMVLQGAEGLLRESRINCVFPNFLCEEGLARFKKYFEQIGYCFCKIAWAPCANGCKSCLGHDGERKPGTSS